MEGKKIRRERVIKITRQFRQRRRRRISGRGRGKRTEEDMERRLRGKG
jgi:hypothetical protein